jgi:coproporphyrinogen III oxidase-like Fe-S oxidoreductase
MIDPLTIATIAGVGLGALKHMSEGDNRKQRAKDYARSKKYDKAVALYSPWTRLQMEHAQRPQEETMFGNMLGGGLAGFGFGQQMGAANAANELNQAKINYWHSLKSPPKLGTDYGTEGPVV